jgi:hypothetical protein
MGKVGVPQKNLWGMWGSANFLDGILGSTTTKRLKNTALGLWANSFEGVLGVVRKSR